MFGFIKQNVFTDPPFRFFSYYGQHVASWISLGAGPNFPMRVKNTFPSSHVSFLLTTFLVKKSNCGLLCKHCYFRFCTLKRTKCGILASDGLWCTNNSICEFILHIVNVNEKRLTSPLRKIAGEKVWLV